MANRDTMPQAKIGCPTRLLGATEGGIRFRSTDRFPAAIQCAGLIDRTASRQDRGLAFGSFDMTRSDVEKALAAAIDTTDWKFPGVEMAPIAYRRWITFSRRNKSKRPTMDERVLDLSKGMQAHFEPDIPYTSVSAWLNLASVLAEILAKSAR